MARLINRFLTTAQTWFPWSRPLKFEAYNFLTTTFGAHVEPEFKLLPAIGPIALALDVGGNWGQSVEALRYYAKPKRIMTFEPNPVLSARLERVYRDNAAVEVQRCGLAEADGRLKLYIPKYNDFIFDGLASMQEGSYRSWLSPDRLLWYSEDRLSAIEAEAPIRRLDDFDISPQVVKLDIQGYEINALRGGEKTFARCRPFTILEDPNADCVAFFARLGMANYVLEGEVLHQGRTAYTNTLFLTDEHVAQLTAAGPWRVG
jgi:FkbM family methyltransferase